MVTVIVNEPVVAGLTPSFAVHETVVVPMTKTVPDAGAQATVPLVAVTAG